MTTLSNARWAALGAAVAVALGAASIGVVSATVSSGGRAVFVPITPCRLVDTRPGPGNLGPRSGPIAGGETQTFAVTGANGQCVIPTGASAIVANVTVVAPTAATFVTLWPADKERPGTSSLNVVAGQAPTPNGVTVALSSGGAIKAYNDRGAVHLVIDVAGYYEHHTHDDRYYTKSQIDQRINARGYARLRMTGTLPGGGWKLEFSGPVRGFLSAHQPFNGITCLRPDPAVLTPAEAMGGFLQDASGNGTYLQFDGSIYCSLDEVQVVQRTVSSGSLSSQSFNVLVP